MFFFQSYTQPAGWITCSRRCGILNEAAAFFLRSRGGRKKLRCWENWSGWIAMRPAFKMCIVLLCCVLCYVSTHRVKSFDGAGTSVALGPEGEIATLSRRHLFVCAAVIASSWESAGPSDQKRESCNSKNCEKHFGNIGKVLPDGAGDNNVVGLRVATEILTCAIHMCCAVVLVFCRLRAPRRRKEGRIVSNRTHIVWWSCQRCSDEEKKKKKRFCGALGSQWGVAPLKRGVR